MITFVSAFDPTLLKGHIDKFRQHPHGGFRKRHSSSPIQGDLRSKIRRVPESQKRVLVVVNDVPASINTEESMRMQASAFGAVRRVECDVDARSCQVVFLGESNAWQFFHRRNKYAIEDGVLELQPPKPDPMADE